MMGDYLGNGVSLQRLSELRHFHRLARQLRDEAESATSHEAKQIFLDAADAAIRHAVDTICAFGDRPACPNCGHPNIDWRGPSVMGSWHSREGGAWACHGVLWPTATQLAVHLLDGNLLTPSDLLTRINADLAARPLSQRGRFTDPDTGARILEDLHKHHLVIEAEPGQWTITAYARQLVETHQRRERAVARTREQGGEQGGGFADYLRALAEEELADQTKAERVHAS